MIQYKRWIQTVYENKGFDDIERTVGVNIQKIEDSRCREMFIEAAGRITHRSFTQKKMDALKYMIKYKTANIDELTTFLSIQGQQENT